MSGLRSNVSCILLLVVVTTCIWIATSPAQTRPSPPDSALSDLEQRGKDIYFGVESSSTPIKATIGNPPTEVQASMMACVNCHGEDGVGRAEGGVVPSNITWEALTKPYGVVHSDGRAHPAYNERLIIKAMCMGLDPAGHQLHVAMPRFQFSRNDANAVVAYLKKVGKDTDPGISTSAIRVGAVLPSGDAGYATAVRAMLTAYFTKLNAQDGIYGRSIELVTMDAGRAIESGDIDRFIQEQRPFAVMLSSISGFEQAIVDATERNRIPLVASTIGSGMTDYAGRQSSFFLLSGIEQQARALIDFCISGLKLPTKQIVLVHDSAKDFDPIADRLAQYCKEKNWRVLRLGHNDQKSFANDRALDEYAGSAFLILDELRPDSILASSLKRSDSSVLLMPGALLTNQLIERSGEFKSRIYAALPSLPTDQSLEGASEYRTLVPGDLSTTYKTAQISALCAAKVLVQALKTTGRNISREKVITSLEGLTDFDTGYTPKISFGPNRRVGALGAYIVSVNPNKKALETVTGWLAVE